MSQFLKYLVVPAFFLSVQARALHVILDPGHGGRDHGAQKAAVREADITLKVSLLLAELLEKDPGFRVSITRNSDKTMSLSERARFAVEKNGEVFLSIHANASPDSRAHGGEFYFQNQLPPDEEAMYLANYENEDDHNESLEWPLQPVQTDAPLKPDVTNILKDLQRNFRIKMSSFLTISLVDHWRGDRRAKQHSIRQAPFYVISNVSMPSTLVELGFLTNRKEAAELQNAQYQQKLALGLYKGLVKYKEVMDKGP